MSSVSAFAKNSAAAKGLAGCHRCGLLMAATATQCKRCGAAIHLRKQYALQTTLALTLTALLLYIPANLLPVMTTITLGSQSSKTILGGVLVFIQHGDLPIALVIFLASVVIPIAKLLVLSWLCFSVVTGHQQRPRQRTWLYRVTEMIGHWSMVDVFVVAVLVALVQLGNIITIEPGPAAIAFALMVIVTMLAAMSFDPRLIWDALERERENNNDG